MAGELGEWVSTMKPLRLALFLVVAAGVCLIAIGGAVLLLEPALAGRAKATGIGIGVLPIVWLVRWMLRDDGGASGGLFGSMWDWVMGGKRSAPMSLERRRTNVHVSYEDTVRQYTGQARAMTEEEAAKAAERRERGRARRMADEGYVRKMRELGREVE